MRHRMPHSTPALAYIALSAAGICWGTGFLFGKMALDELSVGHMLLYRFAIGSIAFVPIAWTSWTPIPRAHWPALAWAAALGVPVQFLVQFEGLARTTVAHASLMVAGLPILLAIAAAAFARERLARWEWGALASSTAGGGLIAFGTGHGASSGATLLGDGLVLVSLLAAVAWILLSKRLTRRYPPSMVSAATIWTGTVLLAAWSLARDGPLPVALTTETWLALLAQGVLPTMAATSLWNWGVARVPAGRAGAFVNLEPIVGAALGVLVLGEALEPLALAGGVLIIGAASAIAVSGWRMPSEPEPAPPSSTVDRRLAAACDGASPIHTRTRP
jgi:drug/metabolite transporter (DMT)-like permease